MKSCKRIILINEHHAKRAGLHYDIRFGAFHPQYNTCVFFSWATRKWIDFILGRKNKILLFETEIHSWNYQYFEGEIEAGYGAGINKIWFKGEYQLLSVNQHRKRDYGEFYQCYLNGKIKILTKLKDQTLCFTLIRVNIAKHSWLAVRSIIDEIIR